MRRIQESEGRCLIDGNVDRTRRICLMPCVNQFAVDTQVLRIHEISFWLPVHGCDDARNATAVTRGNELVLRTSHRPTVILSTTSGDLEPWHGMCPML